MDVSATLLFGDCKKKLKDIKSNSVDLIFTSPPYCDSRRKTYGGIHPDKYANWFLPRTYTDSFKANWT